MKKTLILLGTILVTSIVFLSFQSQKEKKPIVKPKVIKITNEVVKTDNQKVVNILPLGDVSPEYLNIIKNSVESFYKYKCEVRPQAQLTDDLLAKSKTRYSADAILEKYDSNKNLLIITERDIATPKDNYDEWGVLGLGYRPGNTCVVSTYRMKRNVSAQVIKDRVEKVSLHEIGHNLGLDHCDYDIECLMNDARGTIKQVDKEKKWLCKKCCNIIKRPYIEK